MYFTPYLVTFQQAEQYREGWQTRAHTEIPATVIAAVFQFTNALHSSYVAPQLLWDHKHEDVSRDIEPTCGWRASLP